MKHAPECGILEVKAGKSSCWISQCR